MFTLLLPRRIDNDYRGRKLALWLLAVLLFARTAMSLNSIFNGYVVATTADGIPLQTYAPAAARAAVSLFALLGLSNLILCLLGIVVLVRYRAMAPLLFALFLLQYLGGRVVLRALPIERSGTPPGPWINLALLVVMVAGLVLSLWRRTNLREHD